MASTCGLQVVVRPPGRGCLLKSRQIASGPMPRGHAAAHYSTPRITTALSTPTPPLAHTHTPLVFHSLQVSFHDARARSAIDAAAVTSPKYRGLSPLAVEQAIRNEYPRLLEALATSSANLTPATAPKLLRRLEAELPPALHDIAPSGDCVLVAITPGLLPLLEHSAECCEQALLAGGVCQAVAAGKAVLCLLSCLRFGSPASAAAYAAVAMRTKQALKAAYDVGAEIVEEDITELHTACSTASRYLWLTPYFGHRFACAVDDYVTAGWSTGEMAVRFTEAWASLAGQGRYTQMLDKYVRLVRAALQHSLSLVQLGRLLATTKRLPVEMSIALELHARSEPADCWYHQLIQRMRQEEKRSGLLRTAMMESSADVNGVVLAGTVRRAMRTVPAGQQYA